LGEGDLDADELVAGALAVRAGIVQSQRARPTKASCPLCPSDPDMSRRREVAHKDKWLFRPAD